MCLKITKGHIIPQRESLYKSTRAGNWSGIGGGEMKVMIQVVYKAITHIWEEAPRSLPSVLNLVGQKDQNNRSTYKTVIELDSWVISLVSLEFYL